MKVILGNSKRRHVNTLVKALFLSTILIDFSCKKIVQVQSERLVPEINQWKKLEDGRAALIGMYTLMSTAMVSDNTHWLMGDLRNGDFVSTSRTDLKAIIDGNLNATYPTLTRITDWRRFYAVINAASLIIERSREIILNDARYTPENNAVDVAQARAMRAFAYFYMVRLFGDVPLIISSHDGEFINVPRSPKEKVLSFATSELLSAAKIVPFRYGGTDPILPGLYYGKNWGTWRGALFTKLSVYAMLAHIAAWQGNYLDCEVYTKYFMDNVGQQNGQDGGGTLAYSTIKQLTEETDGPGPFANQRITQVVGFSFEQGQGSLTTNGHIEQLTLATPFIVKERPDMFVPKDTIRKAFTDPKDIRFSKDPLTQLYRTYYFYNYSSEMPIFNKIKVITGVETTKDISMFGSACVFTRYEEITLLRAEALAALGLNTEAIAMLDRIRQLREEAAFDPKGPQNLIDAIFAERRRELMAEGWRWYDIVRLNRLKKSDAIFLKKGTQSYTFKQAEELGAIYWPVSNKVIVANPLISQNSYWN